MEIMRLFISFFLVTGCQATYQVLRGGSSRINNDERHLSPTTSGFASLSCNALMSSCVNWSDQGYDPTLGVVEIPCGSCVVMDVPGPLDLTYGLDVVGKLVFPDGHKITITTPFIYVQGMLEMTSTRSTSGEEDVKIIMTGDSTSNALVPHTENSAQCPATGCPVGNRPVVVAGGTLNINGLPTQCPSWTKLKNIVGVGPPANANIPTYVQPAAGCSDTLIETDFENSNGIGWPDKWYRNYGGTDSYETDDDVNYYALFGGRKSSWNGPQTNFNFECVESNVPMFATAKIKFIGITEHTCIGLTYFGQEADGAKSWRNKGRACTDQNNTWFDFASSFILEDDIANPIGTPLARRFYWDGPGPGVDVAIDDIKIFRAPESTFPDPNAGSAGVCTELLTNGDAEDTALHPFTYPFGRNSGASELKIDSEVVNGATNYFFAMSNRQAGWDNPSHDILTDCVQSNSVYAWSVDIRVHSSVKKEFRMQFTVIKADGSKTWPWLGSCQPQDINDGWVNCSGEYEFKETEATAQSIKIYPVSDDSVNDDVDFDNFSLRFKSGPINALILPDDTGDLASCWGAGSEILVTSKSLNFDDVDTPIIQSVDHDAAAGTTKLTLQEPIGLTSYSDNEGDFGVEVALLSRNIVFDSDSTTSDKGGHLMVLKTPSIVQILNGVSISKFGQQGELGKYPVHFHLCQSVLGSVVSKNVVRDSNQRCYVVHGSNDLVFDSNIGYNTHGHCFLLEDSGETGNAFTRNLVSVTRKVTTIIRPEETDDFPSSFWFTNPNNTFVGNVAAGSEHSGFWFEMKSSVRAPTDSLSSELASMNPSTLPLALFKDNVAHSNYEHGVKTYPGHGYKPDVTAVFENTKSYRNKGSGVFIHNSRNIAVDGGVFADNRIQVDVDRSPTCSVLNAKIVGYSPEYKALVDSAYLPYHCPSVWPIRGVELHTYWAGGDVNSGTTVADTTFEHFDDSGCDGSTALRIDPENKGYFDVRNSISGLTFSNTAPLSACDAAYATDQEMGPVDDVAIHDVDGSIMGTPGFIVSDSARMTSFATCFSQAGTCTAHCPGTCFRTMGLSVSTLEDDSVELEITDINTGLTTSFTGEYDWPFDEGSNIDLSEHLKTHRNRRFFATLPAGGSYEARFVKDGQIYWPRYVKTEYEDPGLEDPTNCPDFTTFDVIKPVVPAGFCDELISNGDMELGLEGWWATMGGLEVIDDGTNKALTSEYRTAEWMGPAQFIDTRCMILDATYSITAKVKLINKDTSSPVSCDPTVSPNTCPKLTMKGESGTWEDTNEFWHHMGTVSTWDQAGGWNTIVHSMTVSQAMVDAGSILIYSESSDLDALIVFDDVSFSLQTTG